MHDSNRESGQSHYTAAVLRKEYPLAVKKGRRQRREQQQSMLVVSTQ